MALEPTRALSVIESDNANIPYPAVSVSGVDDGAPVSQLIDTTKDFTTLGVYAGDIVYNTTTNAAATIVANPTAAAPDTLELNASIFTGIGDSYVIYQSSAQSGGLHRGCTLFVGTGGSLKITTVGGDIITMLNVKDGTLIPVKAIKLWTATTSSNIVALW